MTTIACVWVHGHVPFSSEYVIRLHSMVSRWMDRPYRFVCLCDRPYLLRRTTIETIRIPSPRPLKGWWSKVELFNPRHGLASRVLYLDLDTLIVAPLAPILDFPAPFALAPHSGDFNGKNGREVVKRFNSSVMVWDAGVADFLHRDWTPAAAKRFWGDQDWIGQRAPGADVMPAEWFPRISTLEGAPPKPSAKVVLVKTPKNIQAAAKWEWFRERWQ